MTFVNVRRRLLRSQLLVCLESLRGRGQVPWGTLTARGTLTAQGTQASTRMELETLLTCELGQQLRVPPRA